MDFIKKHYLKIFSLMCFFSGIFVLKYDVIWYIPASLIFTSIAIMVGKSTLDYLMLNFNFGKSEKGFYFEESNERKK